MDYLLYIDLETTGLKPHENRILEVAAVFAEFQNPRKPLATFQSVIWTPWDSMMIHPVVQEMHTKNGLLEECSRSSAPLIGEVYTNFCTFIDKFVFDQGGWGEISVYLAGNSVHFDRSFLSLWMPDALKTIHHRHFDISSISMFCQTLGMIPPPKGSTHRAMSDIEDSMRCLGFCASWIHDVQTGAWLDPIKLI